MRPACPLRGYGRLSEEARALEAARNTKAKRRKLVIIVFTLCALIIAAALVSVTVGILVVGSKRRTRSGPDSNGAANAAGGWKSKAIDTACRKTLYPQLCMSTLVTYQGGAQLREPKDLAHITLNVTMDRVQQAYQVISVNISAHDGKMGHRELVAYEDCVELLQDTIYHLSASSVKMQAMSKNPKSIKAHIADVNTWLSAALTNQDTCLEGFKLAGDGGASQLSNFSVKAQIEEESTNLAELVSNSLAMFQILFCNTSSDIGALEGHNYHVQTNNFTVPSPPSNRRRLLAEGGEEMNNADLNQEFYDQYGLVQGGQHEFPLWLSARDRRLLQLPVAAMQPDAVVAKDGSGKYKSIVDALKDAPSQLTSKRYVIYVKAGVYYENVTVSRKKTNIMIVGDGIQKTVVAAGRNVADGSSTFRSATFAASGTGFIARDMTFLNNAGQDKHQAVALRVGADFSAIYRCSIIGYQDTLYVHSLRQFYRECDIYGTVDFIFGNAAVVLQKCTMFARKPMPNEKITITAQGRKDPNQNTGISIHDCKVTAAIDLVPVKASYRAYLGRPWKLYSRTVYLQTFLDDIIDPAGWLEWYGDFALNTLYYGEYMNSGPGAGLVKRVTWPGYRVFKTADQVYPFTVAQFISGSKWLPSTGITFIGGLLV
uniref:Pectinesterase n=1 Tax=Picea sitchensis TaxID=3332 RepID=C0PST8_PICSI|nr:unknown [Picea sitchensis]